MGVTLRKGQKVDLTKSHPGLEVVVAGLGWDVSQSHSQYDLDASAFLIGPSGKVQSDLDFVFYNNPSGGNGSIIYTGDNRTGAGARDDEQIRIDLNKVPPSIHRIAFTITIHDAHLKQQNFGQVSNAYVRIFNALTNEELIRFDLGRDFTVETAIVAAELYRHNGEWKFNAIASGFQGGLGALCRNFGVHIDDEPAPSQSAFQSNTNFGGSQSSQSNSSYLGQQNSSYNQPSFGHSQQPNNQYGYGQSQQHQSSFNQSGFGHSSQPNTSYNQPSFGQQVSHSGYNQPSYGQPNSSSQSYGGDNILCTRCGSSNVRTGQKGFGLGKAAIGGLILGPVGLLGGFIGKNQLKFNCNNCQNTWSPNQTDYAQWANQQKRKAQEIFARYKSQDVMDAVVAACALVSLADGRLDQTERQKMMEFVNQSEELRVFDSNKVIQQFNYFVQKIERDAIIGRAEAFKALGRVRSKPEIARLVARYCIALGYADGQFDPSEKEIVAQICLELGLNPNEFLS
ncbi:TerD family protein [Cytobacillus dafuensis]|uniref:Tellurium resistance protein TerD n=1 Tax=Cytobacillus dafuensis TaxID=1742359 RepID=A0A5B8Z0Q7_CYTDA|nr:TerD family protein [Cytobacillus dafuensis]QED46552.1 tellurium resistance protein TerD [Cytobacillus dafuensis]